MNINNIGKVPDYRPPPNTDPLSYLSNYKRYQKLYIHELLVI